MSFPARTSTPRQSWMRSRSASPCARWTSRASRVTWSRSLRPCGRRQRPPSNRMHHDKQNNGPHARADEGVAAAPGAEPLVPFEVTDQVSAAELVDRMTGTAFQARNLGTAARIWESALRDQATIFFGLSGAMVPAGMRPVLVHMIENRMIDVLVSTGANLYHDVYETLGFTHGQTDPDGDDIRLADLRVVRFYDVLAPEHEFSRGERWCTEFAMTLEDGRPYTTREYFEKMGRAIAPIATVDGGLL